MHKNKTLLIIFLSIFINNIQAQFLWYENETQTENILHTDTDFGDYVENVKNPNTKGINTNSKSSKFTRNPFLEKGYVYFKLYQPIKTAERHTINLKAYINVRNQELSFSPTRLRVYLINTTTGISTFKFVNFTKGKEWQDFSFVFEASDFKRSGLRNGGYNQMYIGFGNGQFSNTETTYYIDQISSSIEQIQPIFKKYLWYENETKTENILHTNTNSGDFIKNVKNPDINEINTNGESSKFTRYSNNKKGYIYFKLHQPIEIVATHIIDFKAYIDVNAQKFPTSPNRLRVYLTNTITGESILKFVNFTKGKEWEDFSVYFEPSDFTQNGLTNGGYNQMHIGFGIGQFSNEEITYYIDKIYGTIQQTPPIIKKYLWYENETKTENIAYTDTSSGTFFENTRNPNTKGYNTNVSCSKFVRKEQTNRGFTYFKLYQPIEVPATYIVNLKAYIDVNTLELPTSPTRLRLYLTNTVTGESTFKFLDLTKAKEWEDFSFIFEPSDLTDAGLSNGGYNQIDIGFGNGEFSSTETTYYIDQISGTVQQTEQYLWYETESETENITFTSANFGSYIKITKNPNTSGINTNLNTTKFTRDASVTNGFTYFELYQPIETPTKYTISLKAYLNVKQDQLENSPNRLLVYLKNTTTGDTEFKQLKFTVGKEWEKFYFVFEPDDFTTKGLANGGYNQMYIGFGNKTSSTTKTTYYLDQIQGTTKQIPIHPNVKSLQGSWGVRLYVRGGEDLDFYVKNDLPGDKAYDYLAGAREIIDSYPTTGHIMTNATNNASSHLWTLRVNKNVDAVMGAKRSVVSEEFVPSLENEQIIIDIINLFKSANKKVILYINAQSPRETASATGIRAWNNYVRTYFGNNEHAAWLDYCEGYIKRFAELDVDGYWMDAFENYPGDYDEKNEFVNMIRNVDPDAIISTNFEKKFITNDLGEKILVDTDGVEDNDERDYGIVKMEATNPWSDFTAGHITPLDNGAPPNSWAYEEFTITDIEESPITSYNDVRLSLKHFFLPIRVRWSSERAQLMYSDKQAYRFVKRIIDAGGAVTFSTTTDTDGTTMEDEESVLKFVDDKLATNAAPLKYRRPLGAFLVSEIKTYPWYENEKETKTDYITIDRSLQSVTTENFPNPYKAGNNNSNTALKSKREGGSNSRIYFNLPNIITDISEVKISLDALINKKRPSSTESLIRVYLTNSNTGETIHRQLSLTSGNTWQNLIFDFTDETPYTRRYDQMAIGFANGDQSKATTKYYFDNIKGSKNQYIIIPPIEDLSQLPGINLLKELFPENIFKEQESKIFIYPNPINDYFQLSNKLKNIEIYSISGQKKLKLSDRDTLYNISNLSTGVYILRGFNSEGKTETLQFIKQ